MASAKQRLLSQLRDIQVDKLLGDLEFLGISSGDWQTMVYTCKRHKKPFSERHWFPVCRMIGAHVIKWRGKVLGYCPQCTPKWVVRKYQYCGDLNEIQR